MRTRSRTIWSGVAILLLVLATAPAVVHVPPGSVAVLTWRGGGTPALLGPGFALRVPLLQSIDVYPGGVLSAEGIASVASREGSSISIPYRVEIHPGEQRLLALHQEGKSGGAEGSLRAFVEEQILKAAASSGSYDLASGVSGPAIDTQVLKTLEERFGPGPRLVLSAPRLPPEVRASFDRDAIYARRRETGVRIVLVGIDGGDWDVIDPMIARRELPNLARLKRDGAWSRMRSNVPTLSPLLWTTVATGKAPDRHGINDFLVVDPKTGRQLPINSTFRKAKAIWNILSEAGLQNDIIAWWATWPAEPIEGHLISDRVAYSTWEVGRPDTSRDMVHPPGYTAVVARLRVPETVISYRQVAGFAHIDEGEFRRARDAAARKGAATESQESINVLVRVLASTETYRKIALDLLETRERTATPARFFAVYFQGVDEVNHRFAHCAPPRAPLCSDSDYRRFRDVVPAFYRYQDGIVGEILKRAAGATVIVMSDHGFASGDGRPKDVKPFIDEKPGLWHHLAGIFIASGPAIRRGEIPLVTLYDIAPTVLDMLGLPVPEDMPGKVLEAALDPAFPAAHPIVRVPSYEGLPPQGEERRAGAAPGGAPVSAGSGEALPGAGENEMLEQLRSLGYVGAGAPPGGPALPAGTASSQPPAGAAVPTLLYHTNLATVYLGKRQYDQAEAEYHKALQIDPTAPQALMGLAAMYETKGEPEKALEILETLEGTDATEDGGPLLRMAALFIRLGRVEDGVAFMRRIEARHAAAGLREIGLRVALGMLESSAGRSAEAESSLLKALALDPASVSAMQELFALYDGQGRAKEIEPKIRTALQRAPGSAMHHNWLGLVLRRRDDLKGAEAEFKKTLQLAPGLTGAMANLGSLYLQEGRAGEAVAVLKGAIERDPQSIESRTNLIVALGMTRDPEGARREVHEAESAGRRLPVYYNALAYALYYNGLGDEALETLRQSLTIDPRQPDALRLRAEIERGQPVR